MPTAGIFHGRRNTPAPRPQSMVHPAAKNGSASVVDRAHFLHGRPEAALALASAMGNVQCCAGGALRSKLLRKRRHRTSGRGRLQGEECGRPLVATRAMRRCELQAAVDGTQEWLERCLAKVGDLRRACLTGASSPEPSALRELQEDLRRRSDYVEQLLLSCHDYLDAHNYKDVAFDVDVGTLEDAWKRCQRSVERMLKHCDSRLTSTAAPELTSAEVPGGSPQVDRPSPREQDNAAFVCDTGARGRQYVPHLTWQYRAVIKSGCQRRKRPSSRASLTASESSSIASGGPASKLPVDARQRSPLVARRHQGDGAEDDRCSSEKYSSCESMLSSRRSTEQLADLATTMKVTRSYAFHENLSSAADWADCHSKLKDEQRQAESGSTVQTTIDVNNFKLTSRMKRSSGVHDSLSSHAAAEHRSSSLPEDDLLSVEACSLVQGGASSFASKDLNSVDAAVTFSDLSRSSDIGEAVDLPDDRPHPRGGCQDDGQRDSTLREVNPSFPARELSDVPNSHLSGEEAETKEESDFGVLRSAALTGSLWSCEEQHVQAAEEGEEELSELPRNAVALENFLHQYDSTLGWLSEIKRLSNHEMASLSEQYLFSLYCTELSRRPSERWQALERERELLGLLQPQLLQEIDTRLCRLRTVWDQLQRELSAKALPCSLDKIVTDVQHELDVMSIWLSELETALPCCAVFDEEDFVLADNIAGRLLEHKGVQRRIEEHSRTTTAILKLCQQLQVFTKTPRLDACESRNTLSPLTIRGSLAAVEVEAVGMLDRWQTVWFQTVELQASLEDRFRRRLLQQDTSSCSSLASALSGLSSDLIYSEGVVDNGPFTKGSCCNASGSDLNSWHPNDQLTVRPAPLCPAENSTVTLERLIEDENDALHPRLFGCPWPAREPACAQDAEDALSLSNQCEAEPCAPPLSADVQPFQGYPSWHLDCRAASEIELRHSTSTPINDTLLAPAETEGERCAVPSKDRQNCDSRCRCEDSSHAGTDCGTSKTTACHDQLVTRPRSATSDYSSAFGESFGQSLCEDSRSLLTLSATDDLYLVSASWPPETANGAQCGNRDASTQDEEASVRKTGDCLPGSAQNVSMKLPLGTDFAVQAHATSRGRNETTERLRRSCIYEPAIRPGDIQYETIQLSPRNKCFHTVQCSSNDSGQLQFSETVYISSRCPTDLTSGLLSSSSSDDNWVSADSDEANCNMCTEGDTMQLASSMVASGSYIIPMHGPANGRNQNRGSANEKQDAGEHHYEHGHPKDTATVTVGAPRSAADVSNPLDRERHRADVELSFQNGTVSSADDGLNLAGGALNLVVDERSCADDVLCPAGRRHPAEELGRQAMSARLQLLFAPVDCEAAMARHCIGSSRQACAPRRRSEVKLWVPRSRGRCMSALSTRSEETVAGGRLQLASLAGTSSVPTLNSRERMAPDSDFGLSSSYSSSTSQSINVFEEENLQISRSADDLLGVTVPPANNCCSELQCPPVCLDEKKTLASAALQDDGVQDGRLWSGTADAIEDHGRLSDALRDLAHNIGPTVQSETGDTLSAPFDCQAVCSSEPPSPGALPCDMQSADAAADLEPATIDAAVVSGESTPIPSGELRPSAAAHGPLGNEASADKEIDTSAAANGLDPAILCRNSKQFATCPSVPHSPASAGAGDSRTLATAAASAPCTELNPSADSKNTDTSLWTMENDFAMDGTDTLDSAAVVLLDPQQHDSPYPDTAGHRYLALSGLSEVLPLYLQKAVANAAAAVIPRQGIRCFKECAKQQAATVDLSAVGDAEADTQGAAFADYHDSMSDPADVVNPCHGSDDDSLSLSIHSSDHASVDSTHLCGSDDSSCNGESSAVKQANAAADVPLRQPAESESQGNSSSNTSDGDSRYGSTACLSQSLPALAHWGSWTPCVATNNETCQAASLMPLAATGVTSLGKSKENRSLIHQWPLSNRSERESSVETLKAADDHDGFLVVRAKVATCAPQGHKEIRSNKRSKRRRKSKRRKRPNPDCSAGTADVAPARDHTAIGDEPKPAVCTGAGSVVAQEREFAPLPPDSAGAVPVPHESSDDTDELLQLSSVSETAWDNYQERYNTSELDVDEPSSAAEAAVSDRFLCWDDQSSSDAGTDDLIEESAAASCAPIVENESAVPRCSRCNSDSDTDDLNNVLRQSSQQRVMTERMLKRASRQHLDQRAAVGIGEYDQWLATCQTNIKCLKMILDHLGSGNGVGGRAGDRVHQVRKVINDWLCLESTAASQRRLVLQMAAAHELSCAAKQLELEAERLLAVRVALNNTAHVRSHLESLEACRAGFQRLCESISLDPRETLSKPAEQIIARAQATKSLYNSRLTKRIEEVTEHSRQWLVFRESGRDLAYLIDTMGAVPTGGASLLTESSAVGIPADDELELHCRQRLQELASQVDLMSHDGGTLSSTWSTEAAATVSRLSRDLLKLELSWNEIKSADRFSLRAVENTAEPQASASSPVTESPGNQNRVHRALTTAAVVSLLLAIFMVLLLHLEPVCCDYSEVSSWGLQRDFANGLPPT